MASHALSAGHILFEKYKITKVLGEGAFGITYLADDVQLEQQVAIKEYLPAEFARRDLQDSSRMVKPLSADSDHLFDRFKKSFLDEAKILAKFRHHAIVRVSNYFEANGTAYLVMEYERGQDLKTYLRDVGELSETEVIRLVMPLLDGLDTLHEMGLIHRDIKPANIYIRGDGTPVLLDFGAARQVLNPQTHSLTAICTPGYAPLEQYNTDASGQGPWSDIYAMGAVLYEIVGKRKPLEANQRAHAHLSGVDPMPTAVAMGEGLYSEAFLAVIDQALPMLGQDRPQTIHAWKQALLATQNFSSDTHIESLQQEIQQLKYKNARLREQDSDASETQIGLLVHNEAETQLGALSGQRDIAQKTHPANSQLSVFILLAVLGIAITIGAWFYRDILGNALMPMTDTHYPLSVRAVNAPTAEIFVDGELRGAGQVALQVTPGRHHLRIRQAGFKEYERMLKVQDSKDVQVTLIAQLFAVEIRCNVADAVVWVDGQQQGQGNQTVHLLYGQHSIKIIKAGYTPFQTELQVTSPQLIHGALKEIVATPPSLGDE